jgi:hypothetical protein
MCERGNNETHSTTKIESQFLLQFHENFKSCSLFGVSFDLTKLLSTLKDIELHN